MSDLVRVGLIGAGPWAQRTHAPALAAGPGTTLAGVWARRPEAARDLTARFGGEPYGSVTELLADCDAVAFAVPPDVQAEYGVQAARAGKPLLLDKPLAMDLAGARRLAAAVAEAGVVSQLVLTLRYAPVAREFLARAAELEPVGGYGTFVSSVLAGATPYSHGWRLERGALLDLGPHVVDLLDASLGRVTGVRAHGNALGWVGLLLEHEGGAVSEASLSMAGTGALPDPRIEVYGRGGYERLDWSYVAGDVFATMVSEFAQCVRTGVDHPLNAAHGLRIQEILTAAAEQLEGGRE